MPSFYVDTGCDNQIRVDAGSQEEAIEQFLREGYWHGSLEKQKDRPYEGWSAVTFYVSPAKALCFSCEKEPVEGSLACEDHVVYEDEED